MVKEGENPVVQTWVQKALDSGTEEIEMPDSLLVGVEIDHRLGILNVEKAEWGEMLGYGAKLTKEDLEPSLIAMLELSHLNKNPKGDAELLEATILRQEILDFAKKKQVPVIGGDVTIFFLQRTGEIQIRAPGLGTEGSNGRLTMKIRDFQLPLSSFQEMARMKTKIEENNVLEL